ncbi:MAG: hypothetical protein AB1498_04255 [bacterium]
MGENKPAVNQKGIALVIAMLFLAVIAIFITVFLYISQHEIQLSSTEEKTEKAFYYANAGIHEATFKLSQNENYGATNPSGNYSTVINNTPFDSGVYSVRVRNTISSNKFITIESQGKHLNRRRRIELVLKKTTVEDPDTHFEHAVFSDGDLTLHGGITVNGDLYANGDLNQDGGSATINGNISSHGTSTAAGTVNGVITSGAAELPPISFNFDLYASAAVNGGVNPNNGEYLYSTGVVISNYDTLIAYLNSHDAVNPAGLIYYNGDLTIDQDVYLNGTIVVNGNFTLQSAIITHVRNDADPDGNPATNSNPGVDCPDGVGNPFTIAATGNITLSGRSESTDGVLFTEGNFTLNGNSGIGNGALFAKGAVFNGGGGAYNVAFDTTLLELVIPGVGLDQLTTYSWKELTPDTTY